MYENIREPPPLPPGALRTFPVNDLGIFLKLVDSY